MDSLSTLPPGLVMMLGALLVPALPRPVKQPWLLLVPILSFLHMWSLPLDHTWTTTLFDLQLTPIRVDGLSRIFGVVFHIAAFVSVLFALKVRDDVQHVAGLIYAGSAIAAAFAGDLVSLFVQWELTAISSVFLIWASRTEHSTRVGLRYLIIQVGSGVILLAGVLLHVADGFTLEFSKEALLGVGQWDTGLDVWAYTPGVKLIFLAFAIKAAFPFLHNWLQDSYPAGTATGTVFLSAFTTKLAIYAFARGFAGTELLIPIGAVMTAFPIFFAVMENDLRRVLAYSLNNQLGFMIVGVGVGTQLALNGAAAHAFAHILYKGLLFMAMGAVLYRVGTTKATELGDLYKYMPLTALFCVVGSLSISAFPLFSGFVSKSLTLSAVAEGHYTLIWVVLLFASAGVVDHSGIKVPFFSFFARKHHGPSWDELETPPQEAPWNMLLAMGITATLCIGMGVWYAPLYSLLPFEMEQAYVPYTADHVVTQLQLLLFAGLAFAVMMRMGTYPPEVRAIHLDTDWMYRKALPAAVQRVVAVGGPVLQRMDQRARARLGRFIARLYRAGGPESVLARTWPTGATAMWAAVLLGAYMVLYYL
ncbi:MAG: Na(+)/H(+) antiporter subunit D [Alphaproteobacteria bacterium]|nr:Na(+)/H(+) antiporter subunit D [Alphaproteobacteria bacterium]